MDSSDNFEPVIVAFCCHYCAYTAADMAGSKRLHYPPNVKIVRVPCSGKVDALHIMKALEKAEKAGKIRFKLFVIEGRDQKECRYMIHEYLEHTGNLQIKIEEGRFQLKDPYHGGMDFYWKGRYIWGALDLADETLRSRVLKLFAEGLEKEK